MSVVLAAVPAFAGVIATVDRTSVELNESFTFKLTVDSQIDAEPNIEALDENFYVASVSNISNTTILNGEVNRSRTWTYVLMAKHDGNLEIPSISVGTESSNPVVINVLPESTAAPGEADIFITAEVDNVDSYVQAQILYTVKTYRAVATRQPRWSEPQATGVESLVEIAGEEKNYEALLDGKQYNVIERVYAVFPQESGQLNIEPARFEARVLQDGRITGRKVFQSDPIAVKVNPIPPPPADYPDAAWFPASAVELTQDWSREFDELPVGEPVTRHVTVIAAGQLQTQIPEIKLIMPDSIRVYPDKPEERTVAGRGGIQAMRRDQYALIGTEAGQIVLPGLVLPWWNINTSEWQFASLPATTLNMVPSPNVVVVPEPEALAVNLPVVPPEAPVNQGQSIQSQLWQLIAEGLAVLWILTVSAWWWSRRAPRAHKPVEPKELPVHKQQSRLLKNARKAAHASDSSEVKSALLAWARLQWPDDAPRNIGDLALRVTMPLSTELNHMCSANYGPGISAWSGEKLAKALKSFSLLGNDEQHVADAELPPLFPNPAQ